MKNNFEDFLLQSSCKSIILWSGITTDNDDWWLDLPKSIQYSSHSEGNWPIIVGNWEVWYSHASEVIWGLDNFMISREGGKPSMTSHCRQGQCSKRCTMAFFILEILVLILDIGKDPNQVQHHAYTLRPGHWLRIQMNLFQSELLWAFWSERISYTCNLHQRVKFSWIESIWQVYE